MWIIFAHRYTIFEEYRLSIFISHIVGTYILLSLFLFNHRHGRWIQKHVFYCCTTYVCWICKFSFDGGKKNKNIFFSVISLLLDICWHVAMVTFFFSDVAEINCVVFIVINADICTLIFFWVTPVFVGQNEIYILSIKILSCKTSVFIIMPHSKKSWYIALQMLVGR